MSFARKVKRANFIKEKKAKIKEAKHWYVRTVRYRNHFIEQKPNHTIVIYDKEGKKIAETSKCHKPMSDKELFVFFDLWHKLTKKQKDGKELSPEVAKEIADEFFAQRRKEVLGDDKK